VLTRGAAQQNHLKTKNENCWRQADQVVEQARGQLQVQRVLQDQQDE
jgi:hypothetical protein